MEAVVTTGAINHAKLLSNHHHQQTSTQFFYRPDTPPVAQPTMSKHWRENIIFHGLAYPQAQLGVFQLCLWPLIAPGYLGGGLPCLSSALWFQYPTYWHIKKKFLQQCQKACWVSVCWWWRFHWNFAHLIAPVITVTSIIHSNKIQNGDILVPACPGCPGKLPLNKCHCLTMPKGFVLEDLWITWLALERLQKLGR